MFEKLKQFKDLRDKAKILQTALAKEHVEGSAAWGKVKVEVDGNLMVTGVEIDPAMLVPADKLKLEDALKDAVNDATKKAQQKMAAKLKEMGGLDLPGLS